jgi:hypothetical protein
MSYRGRREGNYGNQRRGHSFGFGRRKGKEAADTKRAKRNFEARSQRSQTLDLLKVADLAPNIGMYLKHPDRFDWSNVDTADARLIFSRKSVREKAADLSKMASRVPLEVWVRDTSQHDLQNIDTPNAKTKGIQTKILRKFRIVKKDKKTEKPKDEVTTKPKEEEHSPLVEGQHMPSEAEILAKAKELWLHDNARFEDLGGTQIPERNELREEGYLKKAQLALMTSEDTQNERKVLDYVGGLKDELEKIGFTVIPIAGFEI